MNPPDRRVIKLPFLCTDLGSTFTTMVGRAQLALGCLLAGLMLSGCSSGSSGHSTSSSAAATSTPPVPATSAAALAGAPTCPTMAQADAALGVSDSGPISTSTPGNGIVCRYSGAGGTAAVAIFAHQSPAIFGRQVVNAVGAPAMPKISGVGDGAYGQTIGGRSIVNAYSNAIRTVVAAQAPGSLAPVEALARVALADN